MSKKQAQFLQVGDFLTDLDNGYVFIAEPADDYRTYILFHDAEGNENEMTLQNELRLNVKDK